MCTDPIRFASTSKVAMLITCHVSANTYRFTICSVRLVLAADHTQAWKPQ